MQMNKSTSLKRYEIMINWKFLSYCLLKFTDHKTRVKTISYAFLEKRFLKINIGLKTCALI